MSNPRNSKSVIAVAMLIVLGTIMLVWGNARAQSASGITVATGTPQPNQLRTQYNATLTPQQDLQPIGSGHSVPEVRVESNLNTTNPNQGAITPSVGTNAPIYQVTGNCTPDAQGTFIITNMGGPMTGNGTWVLTLNGTPLAPNTFILNPGQSVTINTSGLFGSLALSVSGGGGQPASATTTCMSPTATLTSTPTNTPVPPIYQVNASCTPDAQGTFIITNTGGPMTGNGTWVLTLNGTPLASNAFSLNPGVSLTIGTSGLYGSLVLSVSGGGGQPVSATTTCLSPTATLTSTPTNTPVPPIYQVNASCTPDAQGTFIITNTGGPMTGNGTWVLTLNGTPLASNTFTLNPGVSLTIGTSGLYGSFVLSVSGGGGQPASAQAVCGPLSATPTVTNTPANTATFTPSNTATQTPTKTPTSTATPTNTPLPAKRDTIGVYRGGTFYLRLHNSTGYAEITVGFTAGSKPYPIVGDWTGAGFDTVGMFDQSNGLFSLCTVNDTAGCANSANQKSLVLGMPNDQPLSGRWQISATNAGVGVSRPSNGLIYLKNALATGYADYTIVLGIPSDVGLAGDWNGKGYDSPGVYRPGNSFFYLSNVVTNGSIYGDYQLQYGIGGDAPLVGDWVAQGHDGIGLFRQSNGFTYLKNRLVTGYADNTFTYGIAGDIPVAGHWQSIYPPIPLAPVLIAKTRVPNSSNGDIGNNSPIGD